MKNVVNIIISSVLNFLHYLCFMIVCQLNDPLFSPQHQFSVVVSQVRDNMKKKKGRKKNNHQIIPSPSMLTNAD